MTKNRLRIRRSPQRVAGAEDETPSKPSPDRVSRDDHFIGSLDWRAYNRDFPRRGSGLRSTTEKRRK